MEKEYNGWKNRQTWNVALWINNDEPLYRAAVEFMQGYKGKAPYSTFITRMGLKGDRTPDNIARKGANPMYETCLELAGAKILVSDSFGSYQGDWCAKVEYNGKQGWVQGSFGSCSGCDAFEAEFCNGEKRHYHDKVWIDAYEITTDKYQEDCPECQKLKQELIEFGESYLEDLMTQEEMEVYANKYVEWDMDSREMLAFIQSNPIL